MYSLIITFIMALASVSGLHDFTVNDIDGNSIDLSQYKGKKVLIVNVASKCGYTPQYSDLQELSVKYADKVTVLGFPANNFGSQEPGTNAEISSFCSTNYGVTFPMFEKISVQGSDQHALYSWLSEETGNAPSWNFCKYLIDEEGKVIGFYPSSVNPMDNEITDQL